MNVLMGLLGCLLMGLVLMVVFRLVAGLWVSASDPEDDDFQFPDLPRIP